jgi:hypothetical protein
MTAFWDIVPCSLIEVTQCFTGVYCLHHQGGDGAVFQKASSHSPLCKPEMSQLAFVFHALI